MSALMADFMSYKCRNRFREPTLGWLLVPAPFSSDQAKREAVFDRWHAADGRDFFPCVFDGLALSKGDALIPCGCLEQIIDDTMLWYCNRTRLNVDASVQPLYPAGLPFMAPVLPAAYTQMYGVPVSHMPHIPPILARIDLWRP